MRLFAAAFLLALSACAVGPDYARPQPRAGSQGAFLSTQAGVTSPDPAVTGEWWRLYQDPVLDRLIADALAANTDVRAAVARLERARASHDEVRAARTPQVDLGASAQYGRRPGPAPGAEGTDNLYVSTGLSVAYEVDLFGRIGRGVEAAQADIDAASSDANSVRVAIAAETARAYADAVSTAERIAVANRILALLDRSTELMHRRELAGFATPLDTARIRSLREQRRADIPPLEAQRSAALFRLATLTGRAPAELPGDAALRATTLKLERPIPVGDGSALLARRPDVLAAERRLAASTARIGVATADLYPRITLGATFGSNGAGLGNLFGAGPLTWLLGPLLNWSVNQAPARARIAQASADSRIALAQFDGTVLQALEETETALTSYARLLERRTALQAARDDAATAARITRARQRVGQIDSLELLDAERTLAGTEANLAAADAAISRAQVDLFKALGGGWQQQPA